MEKEFSPMEAFTCKVIFLKDEMGNNIKFEYMDLIQHATGQYAVPRWNPMWAWRVRKYSGKCSASSWKK